MWTNLFIIGFIVLTLYLFFDILFKALMFLWFNSVLNYEIIGEVVDIVNNPKYTYKALVRCKLFKFNLYTKFAISKHGCLWFWEDKKEWTYMPHELDEQLWEKYLDFKNKG